MKTNKAAVAFAAILILSLSLSAQTTAASELRKIALYQAGGQAEFLIECTKPVSNESFTLMNPNRLVVDLSPIATITCPPTLSVGEAGVEKLVVGQYNSGTARIVFHFSSDILSHRIEETESGLKVIIAPQTPAPVTRDPEIEERQIVENRPQMRTASDTGLAQRVRRETGSDHELKDMSIGFGLGKYYYQDEDFQGIYGKDSMSYRGEIAFRLPFEFDSIDLWASVATYNDTGSTTLFNEEVTLRMTTFSMAVRFLKRLGRFEPFLGMGVDYASYKETLPEEFITSSVGGDKVGYHGQLGCYIYIIDNFSTKIFMKYNKMETIENDITVNLGGIEYGLSLVWHFNL
jgi:hypothetical protein